ncbi:hypothetical protein BCAH820_4370 [Bacillus cereus AH820]|uniref:Uncharacterized protein n=1 Tax=Bacillus cereus (strain AH820) TaxID=405535 RepID=B7JNY0_BACC0|nr:hypothetical protein [Bacillus cereus]ACK92314.1 hypothetical protein BCAH820_4370 [Bacillus cereus AH820]
MSTNTTYSANEFKGDFFRNGTFLTGSAVLADDTAIKIPVPTNGVLIGNGMGFREYFITYFRDGSNGGMQSVNTGEDVSVAGKAALGGTTGPDGKVNLSISDGKLFIENRRGSSIAFKWTILG